MLGIHFASDFANISTSFVHGLGMQSGLAQLALALDELLTKGKDILDWNEPPATLVDLKLYAHVFRPILLRSSYALK